MNTDSLDAITTDILSEIDKLVDDLDAKDQTLVKKSVKRAL